MNIVFLFGAGASYGSGECFPDRPPLGKDLFPELLSRGGIAATIDSELRHLFEENFEVGMRRFIVTRNVDVATVLREMSEYFVPFTPGPNNLYRKLVDKLVRQQDKLTEQPRHRILLATTNYELLLERAILQSGCNLVYPMPDNGSYTYVSKRNVLRARVLNSYWAQRHARFSVRSPTFEVAKVHGSCNFLLDIRPEMFRNVRFEGGNVAVEAPVRPVLPGHAVLDYLRRTDSLAPAISMYAEGKQVLFSREYVREHQARFQAAVGEADKMFLVGIRVWPPDDHIWDHIAASTSWLGYIGREPEDFCSWCEEKNRANYHCLASTFEDALPQIERELEDATS
jgi:hypothetical protein